MGSDSWSTYCLEEGIFQSPSGKGLLGSGGLASEPSGGVFEAPQPACSVLGSYPACMAS